MRYDDAADWRQWLGAEPHPAALATPRLPRDVYTITHGRSYSIGDMLAAFQRHWPGMEYRVVPSERANYILSGDLDYQRPNNEHLREDFGWVPSTSLDDGVAIDIDWIRRDGPQCAYRRVDRLDNDGSGATSAAFAGATGEDERGCPETKSGSVAKRSPTAVVGERCMRVTPRGRPSGWR